MMALLRSFLTSSEPGNGKKTHCKPLQINLALLPGYMDILLSVHFPEAFLKLIQSLRCSQLKCQLPCFLCICHFCYLAHTLPKDTQVLSVDPVRTGTVIYILHSHRMTASVDSVQRLQGASGELVHHFCSTQSQLELSSTSSLGFFLPCKRKKHKHKCSQRWLKEQDPHVRLSRPV